MADIKSDVKIIFADENPKFSKVNGVILSSRGYNVTHISGDGIDISNYIIENLPDIAIINLAFSELDGLGIMRRVCKKTKPHKTKFMIYSPTANYYTRSEVAQSGASYVLKTPFDYSSLCKKLDNVINEVLSEKRYVMANLKENSVHTKDDTALEFEISKLLISMGINPNVKGFYYISEGIFLAVKDYRYLSAVTKELYPQIALHFSTTPSRVERAIRNCIERTWDKGNLEVIKKYFTPLPDSDYIPKPSNSEFIGILAEKLRYKEYYNTL